jgi:hypothetical protein
MLRKQHAAGRVASDGTAESMTATCRARAVHERMPVRNSMQLKGGGRGGAPPCSALEQIVVHEYEKFTPKDPECTLIADLSHFSRLSLSSHPPGRQGGKIALAPTFATCDTKYSAPRQRNRPPEASEVTSCVHRTLWFAANLRTKWRMGGNGRCVPALPPPRLASQPLPGWTFKGIGHTPPSKGTPSTPPSLLPLVAARCAASRRIHLCDGQSRQGNACAKGGNQCLRIDPEEANPPTYVTQQRKNPPIGVASAQDSRVPGDGEDLCME